MGDDGYLQFVAGVGGAAERLIACQNSSMARPSDLIPGNCYFSIGFCDRDLLFPKIQTLRYRGEESDAESGRLWLFDDLTDEYFADESVVDNVEDISVYAVDESQLYQILDLDDLCVALKGHVAGWVPKQAKSESGEAKVSPQSVTELHGRIADLLANPLLDSATVTIKFTDDGFSITKLKGNSVRLSFFCGTFEQPNKEAVVRSLFKSAQIEPDDDYLAECGRMRVLTYIVPSDILWIVEVSVEFFQTACSMRSDDSFKCTYGIRDKDSGEMA